MACEENIHDHRWPMTSHVVVGRLASELWMCAESPPWEDDEGTHTVYRHVGQGVGGYQLRAEPGRVTPVLIGRSDVVAGTTYFMPPGVLHRITRGPLDAMTVTLMVRGRSTGPDSRLITSRRGVETRHAEQQLDPGGLGGLLRRMASGLGRTPRATRIEA
jgi:hypothetical protein